MEHISQIVKPVFQEIQKRYMTENEKKIRNFEKMRKPKADIEILYVSSSSVDDRGKRVIIRDADTENYIWPGDGVQEIDKLLLGLSAGDCRNIERFLRADAA